MHNLRLAVTAAVAACTVALIPSDLDQLVSDPADALLWWEQVGTASATMSLLQGLAVGAFLYAGTLAGLTALAEGLHLVSMRRLLLRLATPRLRHRLVAGVVVGALGTSVPAVAAEAEITVTDLGPAPDATSAADGDGFVLADLGVAPPLVHSFGEIDRTAADDAPPADASTPRRDGFRPPLGEPVADAWLVEPGDHLWSIASRVLEAHRGEAPDDVAVTGYWLSLIAANADDVEDPDLIMPGQVLTLPAIDQG